MISPRYHMIITILAIQLVIASLLPAHPAFARLDDVSELLNLVNGLRAGYGLAPYRVDPGLMALAQEHSEYQAAIHTSTHQHKDGRNPPQLGVVENVAGGDLGFLTPRIAVYEIWADPVHMRAMTGYPAGAMGVGVANDGKTVYYTLEVRPEGTSAPKPGTAASGTAQALLTPIPLVTLVAATPRSDGSIVHVVGYGQALWSIARAYGVQVEQIRAWNNIQAGSSEIYAGQKLLVRPASLTPAAAPLPSRSATAQSGVAAAPTLTPPVKPVLAISPSGSAAALTASPASRLTAAETQAAPQPHPGAAPAGAGPLTPVLAGCIILFGVALLLGLRINKGTS